MFLPKVDAPKVIALWLDKANTLSNLYFWETFLYPDGNFKISKEKVVDQLN